MTATVSPVRMLFPASMRFGVWRPFSGQRARTSLACRPGLRTEWRAEWRLSREMALQPAMLLWTWLSLCALALVCGLLTQVSPGGVSVAAAGLALIGLGWLALRRRQADQDHIGMCDGLVRVSRTRCGHTSSMDFHPRWMRVEPELHDRSLIRLSGQGRSVVIGEFVPPASRRQLAEELRWALRHLDD